MLSALCYLIGGAVFFCFVIAHLVQPDPAETTTIGKVVILSLFWPLSFCIFLWLYFQQKVRKTQRSTAIRKAFYYAFVPWFKYEKVKHYKGSHFMHLLRNVGLALKWLFFIESAADRQFEREVNNNY